MTDVRILTRASPELTLAAAQELCRSIFGVAGTVTDLGSQQDLNFRVDSPQRGRFVLKVANADWENGELQLQNDVMHHVARRPDWTLHTPLPQLSLQGHDLASVPTPSGVVRVRLLTYLDGRSLTDTSYLSAPTIAALGDVSGRVSAALADFDHVSLDRSLQWDLRQSHSVITTLLEHIADPERRELISVASARAAARVGELADSLRLQAVHGDITDDNVVASPDAAGRLTPEGVIDFGDVARGWLVSELAVTAASVLHHDIADPFDVLPAVEAFHRRVELTEAEVTALWPLIVLRSASLVVNGALQARVDPANAYVHRGLDREWLMFQRATEIPLIVGEAAIRHRLGFPAPAATRAARRAIAAAHPLLAQDVSSTLVTVDLGTTSQSLSQGDWLDPAIVERLLSQGLPSMTRYGQYRLTETDPNSAVAPATLAIDVKVHLPAGTSLSAPFDGTFSDLGEGGWRLTGAEVALGIAGADSVVADGTQVIRGQLLATVAPLPHSDSGFIVIQATVAADAVGSAQVAQLVNATSAAGWMALAPNPMSLLGWMGSAQEEPDSSELLRRRDASFARVQERYYSAPPQIERGWRHHLIDIHGRTYLDMMNNVTVLGHGHPSFVADVSRQWGLLNTNSRFHYAAVSQLTEQITALTPPGLDTVFLVNSGSEAVDLALRLATTHTRRRDVVSVTEAYHGWTMAADAISTSTADNPHALATRPEWAHGVLAPNTYRGAFRGPDSGPDYVADVQRTLADLAAKNRPVAAFIAESFYGNAGGIALPAGYLAGVYAAVREHGGVCIADEVQVGYGRLGAFFWGFEQQEVVPDIVTVAKSMGNGQPLGAVITTRAIAESFASEGSFFSSAGGSTVSCQAGLSVLRILGEEELQLNAHTVGSQLRAGLEELAQRHALIGAVHGMGLYMGVEMVTDRDTKEPATKQTYAVCERLLELGVMIQPTGDRMNVLKIKPPLCITADSADFFIRQLDRTLRNGW